MNCFVSAVKYVLTFAASCGNSFGGYSIAQNKEH
jgi:hypothetical protein